MYFNLALNWTRYHENILARTVLNAGNISMDGQKGHVTTFSTTLWTSRWSKGKVH